MENTDFSFMKSGFDNTPLRRGRYEKKYCFNSCSFY